TGNLQCFFNTNGTALNPLGESLPLDKFENEETRAIHFLNVVDGGNVRMIQSCKDFSFPLKPAHPVCITSELFGQNLYRNFPFQLGVPSAIHLAHAAFAE